MFCKCSAKVTTGQKSSKYLYFQWSATEFSKGKSLLSKAILNGNFQAQFKAIIFSGQGTCSTASNIAQCSQGQICVSGQCQAGEL